MVAFILVFSPMAIVQVAPGAGTLQAAVNVAAPGAELVLADGTYTGGSDGMNWAYWQAWSGQVGPIGADGSNGYGGGDNGSRPAWNHGFLRHCSH